MTKKKIILFADSFVGEKLVKFLIKNFKDHISKVITYEKNQISKIATDEKIETFVFRNNYHLISNLPKKFDIGFLLWWPKIIHQEIINLPKDGFYNIHPSLLPFCKGKNPNFSFFKSSATIFLLPFKKKKSSQGKKTSQTRIVHQSKIYF